MDIANLARQIQLVVENERGKQEKFEEDVEHRLFHIESNLKDVEDKLDKVLDIIEKLC